MEYDQDKVDEMVLALLSPTIIVRKSVAHDESIKHQKAPRVPGNIACQFRCSYTGEGTTSPVAFPGVRGGGL